jgi:RimJ/RimL family protein N-acetyltransferase
MRVAHKGGLRFEGVLRGQPAEVGEGRRDTARFGITRSEWLEQSRT